MKIPVPTINDDIYDFLKLFRIWDIIKDVRSRVIFDFSKCNFLRQNAVAFLGGVARYLQAQGTEVEFMFNSLGDWIKMNLRQNGFISAFDDSDNGPWRGNSIPYLEVNDEEYVRPYLEDKWLGRGWVNISDELKHAIVGKVYEIYANAFEHSKSPVGVFSCGQYFKNLNELKLTVIDFGVGIPHNVRGYLNKDIDAVEAIAWAFKDGNSTRIDDDYAGGLGLGLLKNFIEVNDGKMEVFSHDGYCLINKDGQHLSTVEGYFEGTIINITLRCDEAFYCLNYAEESTGRFFII
jgi:hypothetical protein